MFRATIITGFAHTLSTVLIGIIVGVIGYKLSSSYDIISGTVAPAILVAIGIIYIILDFKHHHHHHEINPALIGSSKKSTWALLSSLSLGMFLTPCIEIEAYYFQASTIGWAGIWIVSAVYTFITLGVMLLLVYLGIRGVKHLESHYMEHHSKRVTGIVLILVGALTYFVKF